MEKYLATTSPLCTEVHGIRMGVFRPSRYAISSSSFHLFEENLLEEMEGGIVIAQS